MKSKAKAAVGMSKAAQEQLARDVAAFDAMSAARSLTPPPLRLMPARVSAGELELRRSKRLGVAA
jgi:hypothetical protein